MYFHVLHEIINTNENKKKKSYTNYPKLQISYNIIYIANPDNVSGYRIYFILYI